MSGNTSSSPSARSAGYISGLTANNNVDTIVNVYVDATSFDYVKLSQSVSENTSLGTSSGITTPLKKEYQYVNVTPKNTGKFTFDTLTPNLASNTTRYQIIGSSVKVPKDTSSYSAPTSAVGVVTKTPTFSKKPAVTSDNRSYTKVPTAPQNPGDYDWNLPPHRWSMPRFANSDPANVPANSTKIPSDDRYRRGRIWWKASDTSISTVDANGNTVKIDNSDRKYGFQFLWNPSSFGTSVAVNMDVTPQVQDRFLGTVGAFPATEAISFTLRIDRVNDFACANALFKRPNNIGSALGNPGTNNFITPAQVSQFIKYYEGNGSFTASLVRNGRRKTVESKLVDLFQRGTLADIEYIYRAINGAGPGSTTSGGDYWKNGRGILTADIGFLMPTLLNIDIGPLSYLGYVNNLNVTHTMFTPDMIPIQSDVQISIQLLATAGITSQNSTPYWQNQPDNGDMKR